MTADYLIVGQGIAGSILAWTLTQRGHHVLILNDPTLPAASKVSGGIFNPLTGKKLSRTWKADDLFPFAHAFYADMQEQLGGDFLHDCDVYRPYRSIEEQNSYLAQTADPNIAKYVIDHTDDAKFSPFIENPYGGLQITQSGWVDCVQMLQKIEAYFVDKNQYLFERIDYKKIDIQEDGVGYGKCKVKKILFCEGYEARQNPFFNWLPFNPVKGQSLIAFMEDYSVPEIINQGAFVLPIDEKGTCRLGATYTWHDINWETTADGREYLEGKIKTFLKAPYTILEQQVGIRPSTKDRRPFVGIHPEYSALGIFNGLGTKGVSLAPYFANQFVKFLETGEEIDSEANIERIFSLYFRSK
ncbi:NAD(P)/FAD-dependent oxidoreductase [Runella slithyformis]|uniref:FAD dependent oxidoreductase n=1 Tax=Runella slithyformis (strain ATCC 29530 / DSM 19594 / LMG 11500 / NCIMB 11436 / LSU 4) TaxID=761193 RepID=A0A7U4E6I7_RUNSL|nr:FAD-dependent oxidoreductase [Runella slithyformis]AEI49374.1 FAD dependent oxidoreductase [Runella slithyformis DSM 19594]